MLAALLTNLPVEPTPAPPQHARGGGGYRRRPNEPVKWCEDDLICQEELTKFRLMDEDEQVVELKQAINAIKDAPESPQIDADVRKHIFGPDALTALLNNLEALELVLNTYFMLTLRRRQEDDIAAMLALGIL